jgi:hypothetical protein
MQIDIRELADLLGIDLTEIQPTSDQPNSDETVPSR